MKLPAKVVRSINGSLQFEIRYKDQPYRVKLFKFQENYPDDSYIECTLTRQANGELYFRQDLQALVSEFYTPGNDYQFLVKHDFSHNGYYELTDDRGIPFRLPVPKGMKLLTGSTVSCKLLNIDGTGGKLGLLDTSALFEGHEDSPFPSVHNVTTQLDLDAKGIADRVFSDLYPDDDPAWDPDIIFELLFRNDDYYEQAVHRRLLDYILSWREDPEISWGEVNKRLIDIREAIMYVLERSTILLDLEPSRRKSLQKRLTVLVNNVNAYRRAAAFLESGEEADEVNQVLGSLRTSGYIYEAEKRLDMMMKIFSLSAAVMVENMPQIYEIIHARSEEFWKDEPFRKAFIRLLQMYVDQVRQGVERGTIDNDSTVRSLIEALSIQLLLADSELDSDVFDFNLNLAALYRYSSMLRTSVPGNAIRNAFLSLMDVTRRPSGLYRWNETDAHDLIASKLTASPVGLEETFDKNYVSLPAALHISSDSVVLSRTDVDKENLKTLDLKNVGIWQSLKILTPQKIASLSNTSDLRRARDMWNAIEDSLFSKEKAFVVSSRGKRSIPSKFDECTIRITRQIDPLTFEAVVEDPDYVGKGVISVSDMVNYKVPGISLEEFCDDDGHPYLFTAEVKDVVDNTLHFSILDFLIEHSQNVIQNNYPMLCIIKSANMYGKVGISEWGDAVKFKPYGTFADVKIGDIVVGNYWTLPTNEKEKNYIEGVITEIVEDPDPFNTADAFHALIESYSEGNVYDGPTEEELSSNSDTANSEDLLSDSRLLELTALVERKAALESDYMKAYNHIGFARLLARLGRNESRRDFYEAWMRLISILHHFAINGRIDAEMLNDFEANDKSQFDPESELFRRYLQLKVVSYKGQPQMRNEIWKYMSHNDEVIRNLASNVMAYNLLSDSASASLLGEIEDRINNILHVNARKSTLHSFGSENKTTEFKTSLIFPPDNHMRANPEQQTTEIMKELCALLNADGGTLYLGVNDFGMGVGIENDLIYKDFQGSEDKYDLYFRKSVCRILGKDADAYIDAKFEKYAGKTIYVVNVTPYYTEPLKVNGVIYERHGSSKLPFYNPEDIRRFTERRAQERERRRLAALAQTQSAVNDNGVTKTSQSAASNQIATSVKPTSVADSKSPKATPNTEELKATKGSPEKISTRASRKICPASYDPEHDPSTTRYLEIRRDEFQMIPDFYGYNEDDDDLLLVLPLKDEDIRNWLVLGYQDGTVCRLPLKKLFDKQDYTPGKRYTDTPLIFAEVMSEDEALLTLSRNPNGHWNARADKVESLSEAAGFRSPGERLFNVAKEEYRFNVISGASVLNYDDLFNRTNKDAGKNFPMARHDKLYQQLHRDNYI